MRRKLYYNKGNQNEGVISMYQAASSRYETIPYRRCGASGLKLGAFSLGLWHNFGDTAPY